MRHGDENGSTRMFVISWWENVFQSGQWERWDVWESKTLNEWHLSMQHLLLCQHWTKQTDSVQMCLNKTNVWASLDNNVFFAHYLSDKFSPHLTHCNGSMWTSVNKRQFKANMEICPYPCQESFSTRDVRFTHQWGQIYTKCDILLTRDQFPVYICIFDR